MVYVIRWTVEKRDKSRRELVLPPVRRIGFPVQKEALALESQGVKGKEAEDGE